MRLTDYEWTYGALLTHDDRAYILVKIYDPDAMWEEQEVEPATVGQFTGLYDKKGKEIYEGDIIQFPDGDIVDVEYSDSECSFIGGIERLGVLPTDKATILGNVHDNPELLKGGQP